MPVIRPEPPLAIVQRLVIGALREPASVLELPAAELDLALRLMRRARLLGRLGWKLRELGLLDRLPEAASDQLLSALAVAESRRRVALWELDRIAWALGGDPGFPLVALKGCAYLLAGTPNAAGRLFSDVDLLVPESRLGAVESRLRSRGWRTAELSRYDDRYYRSWAHELPPMRHAEREVEVDLHHNLLMRTAALKPPAELLLGASRPLAGTGYRVLAPVDMVLHAMTHLFHGSEMDDSIRELVDAADLLEFFADREPGFWSAFWPRAVQLDLQRPAFWGLRYAKKLLGVQVPESVTRVALESAPAASVRRAMDYLVIRALLPLHPERPDWSCRSSRRALYLRSHWVKMPPLTLAGHLSRKLVVRYAGRAAA